MRYFHFIVIIILYTSPCSGQYFKVDSAAQEELWKLAFLVGDWEGNGWKMDREGVKHPFKQTEKIQFKLDNTILLIEGTGWAGGEKIHDALAIVSFNKEETDLDFRSYLFSGHGGDFKGELKGDTFKWYPGERIRYIITLNQKGQWHEIGEMNTGDRWHQFLEMTLDKQD